MLIFVPSIVCVKLPSSLARICAWRSVAVASVRAIASSRVFTCRWGERMEWRMDQPNFASIAFRISSSDFPSLWSRIASLPSPWQMWQILAMALSPS